MAVTSPPTAEHSGALGWQSSEPGASGREQVTVPGSDGPADSSQTAIPDLAPGTAIGRYMVLGRLGAGAMGVVYAAYDPELDRKVALKLLHPRGHSSLDSRLRLMREAKALARLSHPNVVAVHDVGTYADRVFLAMEFVDGKTLGAWLKEQPQPWEQVVAIMCKAGEGLAAAHVAGLIHRDFKPDNVLIARDGRVRVLDFGLARSAGDTSGEHLGHESAELASVNDSRRVHAELEAAHLTRTGAMVGTPAYMSPEQHLGHGADARSDQFSFCVTLYQALYGARPFAGERISNLAFQVLQGKISPPPAGSAVPARLRRVVLRGLQASPDDRYPGMPELLAALDHEVGLKRRGGWFVGAAALLVLGVWLGLRGEVPAAVEPPCRNAAALLGDAWNSERSAELERAFRASSLAYAAATWTSVHAGLQAHADRWAAQYTEACEANVVRREQSDTLFDRRMRCLERRRVELRALTEVLARGEPAAIEQAGEGLAHLGDLTACSDVTALTALVDPPEGELKAEVERVAARVAEARALELAGKWAEALSLSAAAIADPAATAYAPLAADALRVHARLQRVLDQPEAALHSLLAAAEAAAAGHDDRAAAEAWSDLVFVAGYDLNDAATTDAYARAASAALLRIDRDPMLAARLDFNISAAQYRLGAVDPALTAGLRALAVVDADPHPDIGLRHRLLANLALIYKAKGQRKEAREALTAALELVHRMSGPDHPGAASLLTNLGELAVDENNLDAARKYADDAAAIRRRVLEPGHLAFADSEQLFGRIAERRGDASGALAHYRRTLELHKAVPRPSPSKVGALYNDIANLAAEASRFEDALVDYQQALAVFTAAAGRDNGHSLSVETNLGETLLALGRPREALEFQDHVAAILERALGPDHPETAAALVPKAMSLRALEDPETALGLLERALTAMLAAPPGQVDPGRLGLCRYVLARTLADLRRDRSRQRQLAFLAEPELAADPENVFSRRALAELRDWRTLQP